MFNFFRKPAVQDTIEEPKVEECEPEETHFSKHDTPKQRSEKIWKTLGFAYVRKERVIELAEYLEMYMLWDKGLPQKPDNECYFVSTIEEVTNGEANKADEGSAGGARQVLEEDGAAKEDRLQE